MHECPECGQTCDCDGEDVWHDNYANCGHSCEPEYDSDNFDKCACLECPCEREIRLGEGTCDDCAHGEHLT